MFSSESLDPNQLEIPANYKIRYLKPGGRITLEAVLRLFEVSTNADNHRVTLYFSARPRFGTQDFKADELLSIERVSDYARIYINHDPRKGEPKDTWAYER